MNIAIGLDDVDQVEDISLMQKNEAECAVCKGKILPSHYIRVCRWCQLSVHAHCSHIIPPDYKPTECKHDSAADYLYLESAIGLPPKKEQEDVPPEAPIPKNTLKKLMKIRGAKK